LSAALCFGVRAAAGDITGQVILTKKVSKKAVVPLVYNVRGAAPSHHPEPSRQGSEFSRVAVILEGGPARPVPPVQVVLSQRGRRFEPELLVVPVGSTVEFPNFDPLFHNVFSLSRAKPFDLGYYPEGKSRPVTFPRPGVVQVYCHLHPNMYAAIVVSDSPRHQQPSENGDFTWTGLPAGEYSVVVWHNAAGLFRRKVQVPAEGSVPFTLRIPIEDPQP
jgi:plastocyanin